MSDASEQTERLIAAIEKLSLRVEALERAMRKPRPRRKHAVELLRAYGSDQ